MMTALTESLQKYKIEKCHITDLPLDIYSLFVYL